MKFKRSSGILMPVSSLPGRFGIGTFGVEAYHFVDFLWETKQTYWQILPLTLTGRGNSPYQSFSAIAGNTDYIDFDLLAKEGYLKKEVYSDLFFGKDIDKVDYEVVKKSRRLILEQAVARFLKTRQGQLLLEKFESKNDWLNDFADFMAIKDYFQDATLQEWPDKAILQREPEALKDYRERLEETIKYYKVTQYFFDYQWQKLKAYANSRGIQIIGDMPIYVAADSVEVWTIPHLFKLDKDRKPLFIGGCPPDDFSQDGQVWENPVYDWEAHKRDHFSWWLDRIQENFKRYDVLRIDHFKGFSEYWEIPVTSQVASSGYWAEGPGYDLFKIVKNRLGNLPIIAENLGHSDKKSEKLLRLTGFPGMKVLEFGFYDVKAKSQELPHYHVANSIVYAGTHDNDTIKGWYRTLSSEQKAFVEKYTAKSDKDSLNHAFLRTLYSSVANIAIIAMQDLLEKDSDCRMNIPNTSSGNWEWRLIKEDITEDRKAFLRHITHLYARENPKKRGRKHALKI